MSVVMMNTLNTICEYKPHAVSFLLSRTYGTVVHMFLPSVISITNTQFTPLENLFQLRCNNGDGDKSQ